MTTPLEFHPIAAIFPLMGTDELQELADDIREHGQREPVVLFEGKVLDGRNRAAACKLAGVKPQTRQFGGDAVAAIAFVWSENFHRRHLDKSQAAMAEAERAAKDDHYRAAVVEPIKAEAEKREKAGVGANGSGGRGNKNPVEFFPQGSPSPDENKTRAQRAKIAGTNPRYVQDADRIIREAPDLAEQVKAGKLKIPQATLELKRREKREALQQAEQAAIETSWRIINEDCLNGLQEIEAGTVRAIFADPPYNIGIDYGRGPEADRLADSDYLAWCEEWLELCRDRLTDDGSLWVMIGDEYAAEYGVILKRLGLHRRAWIKWYETFGVNCANNFNRTSRHIFYCVRDSKRFVFHADAVTRPSDRQAKYGDKRAAPGGKIWDDVWQIPRLTGTAAERIPDFPTQIPLAITRAIVGACSDPGDTVLDPFCGSGSTGVAAIELRRHFVGVEWEERFCDLASLRLKGTRHGDQPQERA